MTASGSSHGLVSLVEALQAREGMAKAEAESAANEVARAHEDVQAVAVEWTQTGIFPTEPKFWDYNPRLVFERLGSARETLSMLALLTEMPGPGLAILRNKKAQRGESSS